MEQTLQINEIKSIYDKLIESKYSNSYIIIYFFVKYYININTYDFARERLEPIIETLPPSKNILKKYFDRLSQTDLQNKIETLNKRFDSRCVITGSKINDICYFVNKPNTFDINNCLLINKQHSEYFNKYYWSIEPETFEIEVNYDLISSNDIFIKLLEEKKLEILKQYPEMIDNITEHYETFLYYQRFNPSKEIL